MLLKEPAGAEAPSDVIVSIVRMQIRATRCCTALYGYSHASST